jgi:two-component system, cell cycle sensor histidine kinase and response regulator CckA
MTHVEADAAAAVHMRRAAEHAPIGIICVNGATGQWVFVNDSFVRMLQQSREMVLATDPYQLMHNATYPDDRATDLALIERVAQGEMDSCRCEKRVVRKDGSVCWVAADMLASRDAAGRLAYLTVYFTDIEAQRAAKNVREELESQLRQAQKVEALGRLAGGVAHDFNNRLTVIMSYAELLLRQLPEPNVLRAHAEHVLESAQRASDLTRRLLAYGRRQVLNPQVFDLNAVIERMRHLLERLSGDDVTLTMTLDTDRPILADPAQVEQVILNLVMNARDAMPKGGQLRIETRNARSANGSAVRDADSIELVVCDSGIGIPENVLPRIFEPFFTTKEPGRGTGLGLSTVEGIVLQSGGSIHVESHMGSGTEFTVVLPRGDALPKPVPVRPTARLATGLSFETVLVCDDDEGVREMISGVLGLRGYAVLRAANGREACEVVARHEGTIHLLVTDMVMPEQSGTELAAALRKRHPQLRVLYVSGYTNDPNVLAGDLGPDTFFLAKPFVPSELTSTVCAILETPARPMLEQPNA